MVTDLSVQSGGVAARNNTLPVTPPSSNEPSSATVPSPTRPRANTIPIPKFGIWGSSGCAITRSGPRPPVRGAVPSEDDAPLDGGARSGADSQTRNVLVGNGQGYRRELGGGGFRSAPHAPHVDEMLSRRNVRKGEGSVRSDLACHHRHDHVGAGTGTQDHHRAGCRLALRVGHRARDACHSRRRERDVQREFLTESERQRLRVRNVDRPGIERRCEALAESVALPGPSAMPMPICRTTALTTYSPGMRPSQPKLAKVVGQDERLTAAEGQPALPARPVPGNAAPAPAPLRSARRTHR